MHTTESERERWLELRFAIKINVVTECAWHILLKDRALRSEKIELWNHSVNWRVNFGQLRSIVFVLWFFFSMVFFSPCPLHTEKR
jgi:hypothetical protein